MIYALATLAAAFTPPPLATRIAQPQLAANMMMPQEAAATCWPAAQIPTALRSVPAPRCCATSDSPVHVSASAAASLSFDDALAGILADAKVKGSIDAALDDWLDRLDDVFVPSLANLIAAATDEERPELEGLMRALNARQEQGYEHARDQLQELLTAGEINKMDAQLSALVRKGEVDAGLFYVLLRNQADATAAGDESGARLMGHLYTRLQEELEKKTEPALALLHKLTRTDNSGIRANILRHNLVPQTETLLPDGSTLPLKNPAPAMVAPMALASAISGALDKVITLPVDQEAIYATVEDIRQVAMEARTVVAESYDKDALEEFQDALAEPFRRTMKPREPPPADS